MKTKKLLPFFLTFALVLSVIFVSCDTSSEQNESSTQTEHISNTMTEEQPLETTDSETELPSETELETETHAPFDWVEKSYPDIELTEEAYTLSCDYDLSTFFKAFEQGGDMFATYLEHWEKINPEHKWFQYESLCVWAQLSETLPLILPDDELEVENYEIAYSHQHGFLSQLFKINGVIYVINYYIDNDSNLPVNSENLSSMKATFLGEELEMRVTKIDGTDRTLVGNKIISCFDNREICVTVYYRNGVEATNESLDVLSHFRIAE